MDEMNVYTIRDLMEKFGCHTPAELEEYLRICRDMDEFETLSREVKETFAQLCEVLEDDAARENAEAFASERELVDFLDGMNQLLQTGDAFEKLVRGEPDAKSDFKAVSGDLPDALQKINAIAEEEDRTEMEAISQELVDSTQELNAAIDAETPQSWSNLLANEILETGTQAEAVLEAVEMITGLADAACGVMKLVDFVDEESPEQKESRINDMKELTASVRELMEMLITDKELRDCVGEGAADSAVEELEKSLRNMQGYLGQTNS